MGSRRASDSLAALSALARAAAKFPSKTSGETGDLHGHPGTLPARGDRGRVSANYQRYRRNGRCSGRSTDRQLATAKRQIDLGRKERVRQAIRAQRTLVEYARLCVRAPSSDFAVALFEPGRLGPINSASGRGCGMVDGGFSSVIPPDRGVPTNRRRLSQKTVRSSARARSDDGACPSPRNHFPEMRFTFGR